MSQKKPTETQLAAYADHYVKNGDQSKAWRHTFPESKAQPHTVWRAASLFHKKTEVRAKVDQYRQLTSEALAEEFNISAADIRKMLVGVATRGLRDVNGKPVSLSGTVSALSELNRMNGNHAPTKIGGDPNNPIAVVSLPIEEYKRIRQQVIEEDDC